MLESVAQARALVTAEEGTLTGGFGAEIAARVREVAWSDLRAPVRRVAARDGIIPLGAAPRGRDAPERAHDVVEAIAALEGVRSWPPHARDRPDAREDANTEFALLEVARRGSCRGWSEGSPSASSRRRRRRKVRIEAPGAGTIVQALRGRRRGRAREVVARIARAAQELASLDAGREAPTPAPQPSEGERKATRKAVELAERHGVDLAVIEKRGFITEKDVEALIARQASEATPSARPVLAGVSMEGRDAARALRCRRGRRGARRLVPRVHSGGSRLVPRPPLRREVPVAAGERGSARGGRHRGRQPRRRAEDRARGRRRDRPGATVRCEEVVAIGSLTRFGPDLELLCRRAFVPAKACGAGGSVRFGGGGHRDRGRCSRSATSRSSATRPSSTSAGRS